MLAAFQVRFSLARLRQLLPPSGVADWVSSGWAGVTRGATAAWAAAAAPFRSREPRGVGAAAQEAGRGPQPGSRRELGGEPRPQLPAAAYQARTPHAQPRAGAQAAADAAAGAGVAPHVAVDVGRLEGPAPGAAGQGEEAGGGGAGRRGSRHSRGRRSRRRQEPAADGATESLDRLYAQLMQELEAAASIDLAPGGRRRRRSSRRSNSASADGLPAAAGAVGGLRRGGSLELPRAVDVQAAEDPWASYQSVVFLQLAGVDGPHVLVSRPVLPRRRRQHTPPLEGEDASSAGAVAAAAEGEAAHPTADPGGGMVLA